MVTTKIYTFSNVTENHTISAEFEKDMWTLGFNFFEAQCKLEYRLTPNGTWTEVTNQTTVQVEADATVYMRATPKSGYKTTNWDVIQVQTQQSVETGILPANGGTFSFTMAEEMQVDITTAALPVTHTITATAGTGGTISPSGSVSVEHGTSQSFTVTANSGYHILRILVDGTPIQL